VRLSGILNEGIIKTLSLCYEGQQGKGFHEFVEMMKLAQDVIRGKKSDVDFVLDRSILEEVSDCTKNLRLFRMRECIDPFAMDSRKSIFHVPFDKRNYITSARYSVPGVPSLYLGRSLYVCWEEMKRTSFDNLYFSRFRFDKYIRVLFLAFDPYDMLSEEKYTIHREKIEYQKDLYSFLVLWPLQLACSIPSLDNNASFYPEYIIHQMLMQWIKDFTLRDDDDPNLRIDGICYRTSRVPLIHKIISGEYPSKFSQILNNYVFPVKGYDTKDYCHELEKMFSRTSPISWNLADIGKSSSESPYLRMKISLNDIEIDYDCSVFGKREIMSLSDSFILGKIGK